MKLRKYKVNKFRSVQNSDWIELNQVNALLGENESGKTNLLLPLWKLNPSSGGEISLLSDAPRDEYAEIRDMPEGAQPYFATAIFGLNKSERQKVAAIADCDESWVEEVSIARRYDGEYRIIFTKANPQRTCTKEDVTAPIEKLQLELNSMTPNKTDIKPRQQFLSVIEVVLSNLAAGDNELTTQQLQTVIADVESFDITKVSKTGGIIGFQQNCSGKLSEILGVISEESPTNNPEARKKALELMPTFIYYSNYGNLDGQIYLPRVIQDLGRENLDERESAKARTLKVLFEYVKLEPQEILDLGRDLQPDQANEGSIEAKANQKRERTVLLDSAGTAFTKSFSEWWRQGDYIFQFRADGDHFKIWVSDSVRTYPIELENRSAGLQWFFSFFLVFLNERHDTHQGSILLLDEPGVTLHPMAQKDLFAFFEGLSKDNQLLYTTHSPFLMDPDKLDQVKAVYVDQDGFSAVSSDLRARANSGTDSEQKALFPVHSALGLTVSEVLFIGCTIVLVEGPSDQYYLSAIKNMLIGKGLIHPSKEIVFVPAGGTRGIKTTARILSYDESNYPFVLLDGDASGRQTRDQLEESTFEGRGDLISLVTNFTQVEDAEIEDLMDSKLVAKVASRNFRGHDDFEDQFDPTHPIVPQIKLYCENEGIELVKGWKVDIARDVKKKMLADKYSTDIDQSLLDKWEKVIGQWI